MAYQKLTSRDFGNPDFEFPLVWPELSTFLQAQGWTEEDYVAGSSGHLVMSKGGVCFKMRGSSSCYFEVGTGWDGSSVENSEGDSGYYYMANAPDVLDVYVVADGNNMYLITTLPDLNHIGSMGASGFTMGCGTLEKIGTWTGGLFKLLGFQGCPFTSNCAYNATANSGFRYSSVMTGNVGNVGTAPYMWAVQETYNQDWYVYPTQTLKFWGISNVIPYSLAMPLFPAHCNLRDGSNGGAWVVLGAYPLVLLGLAPYTHKTGDIIDFNGHQYLCTFSGYSVSYNAEPGEPCVDVFYRID